MAIDPEVVKLKGLIVGCLRSIPKIPGTCELKNVVDKLREALMWLHEHEVKMEVCEAARGSARCSVPLRAGPNPPLGGLSGR